MDALFSSNPQGFYSALTQIAAKQQPLDEKYKARIAADCSRVSSKTFKYLHVPSLSEFLSCKSAVEVFDDNVFVDTAELENGNVRYGKFRQSLMLGASHQGAGGRRVYDRVHTNVTLVTSFGFGLLVNAAYGLIKNQRARLFRVPISCLSMYLSLPLFKVGLGMCGFNILWINHHMTKALNALECEQCVQDVREVTVKDIAENKRTREREKQVGWQTLKYDLNTVEGLIESKKFEGKRCVYHSESNGALNGA